MGISFTIIGGPRVIKEEPCLCAQFADCFLDAFAALEDHHRGPLAQEASPQCVRCGGSGVELREDMGGLDFSTANAAILLTLLRFDRDGGEATVVEARRALMRARAASPASFARETQVEHGAPREGEDGVVELRPVRMISFGIDAEGIADRLERISALVEEAADLGCEGISWG